MVVSNVHMALHRRRLCWLFVGGLLVLLMARLPAHALEVISASLRDVTSLSDFIAAVEVGASPSPC